MCCLTIDQSGFTRNQRPDHWFPHFAAMGQAAQQRVAVERTICKPVNRRNAQAASCRRRRPCPVRIPRKTAPAERCRYAPSPSEETVAPEVAASLTDALRAMYDTVVDEPCPMPSRLLSRLDDSDA
jgi:hypothetical protein